MSTRSWRQGLPARAIAAVTMAGALVVSVVAMNGLVERTAAVDEHASGSGVQPPPSAPPRQQAKRTPGLAAPTPEAPARAEARIAVRASGPRSVSASGGLSPGGFSVNSVLGRTRVSAPERIGAPQPPGTSGTGRPGSDSPGPGGQPGFGAPDLPAPPSPPAPPDAPKPDTGKARTSLAAATATVTTARRTIEGIDVDEYVRKYDHQMGSQIRRVERLVTGALPKTSPSEKRPRGSKGTKQNRKQGTHRQQRNGVRGIDVSGWQRNVNWQYWWNKGKRFAYVKATEGTGYKNPYYSQQYNGSRKVGMIRGAYHFALPNRSSGTAQAVYFVTNGGGWARDGKTLPGVLDLEWNPYGPACYGKSKSGMRAWIKAFHDTYKARTGRWPVIYSSTSWWNHCVGSHGFGKTVPLWIARYSNNVGPMPRGWNRYTFWQYSSDPIDQNKFNGSYARLRALANGR